MLATGYKRKVTRVRAAEEGGTWALRGLSAEGPCSWEAYLEGGVVGMHLEGLPVGPGLGDSPWGLCQSPQERLLLQEPGVLCLPRPPPLREASSWGATEESGRAKKLLSHWATREEPRRERPRDRAARPARRGWLLAIVRRAGHSWGPAGWLGVPVVAGVGAWTGPWEGEQVHMGAQYTLRGRRKIWRRRGFLCALRDRKLIPRWTAACSW